MSTFSYLNNKRFWNLEILFFPYSFQEDLRKRNLKKILGEGDYGYPLMGKVLEKVFWNKTLREGTLKLYFKIPSLRVLGKVLWNKSLREGTLKQKS